MDASQWPQQVGGLAKTMEEIATQNNTISSSNNNNNQANSRTPMVEKRARPQKDQNLNCPRCNSTNTKFCYYNNYSLTQPRYFCKTCRRYWTQGGSLRNVPVGGGSRKNKRSSTSSSSSSFLASTSSPSTKLIPDLMIPTSSFSHLITASQNPKFLEGQDLNLAFPIQGIFQPLDHQLPKIDHHQGSNNNNTNNENQEPIMNTSCTTTSSSHCGVNNNNNSAPISALELLRTGIAASRGSLNSYVPVTMPDSNTLYPNLQEFKPNMGVFTSPGDHHHHHDHHGNDNHMIGSGANNVEATGGARLLFPFADMNKLASSATAQHNEIDDQNEGVNDHHHHNHHHHQGPTGYWTGMLGGGTW